jgi:hypothetical protein
MHPTLKCLAVWLLLTLPLAGIGPAWAAGPGDDREVLERITVERMQAMIQHEGFPDVSVDPDGDLIVRMNGYRVLVSVSQNDFSVVLLRFALSGTRATLRDVNEWNSSKLFSRAYIDEDGDPVLEMDVDLAGGVTVARLRDLVRTFAQVQADFLREVAVAQ